MAIAFRATGTALSYSNRTNTTIAAPAGAVNGSDVIVVGLTVENSASVTTSAPTGWTLIGSVSYSKGDPWFVNAYLFVRVHDGSASWTFNHASATTAGAATAWSGVDTTTPIDVTVATNTANGTTATLNSVTIATVGAQEIALRASWDGNAITPPAGWTERLDVPTVWIGDKSALATGATGTTSIPAGNTGGDPWGTIHTALRPGSGFSGVTSGTISIVTASSGTVTTLEPTSGTVAAVTTVTGAAVRRTAVSGTVAAVTATAGAATTLESTSGTVTVTTTTVGAATVQASAAGTVPIVSTVTGAANLGGSLAASGTVAIVTAGSGATSLRATAAGIVPVATTLTGAATTLEPTSGTAGIASALIGAVTTRAVAAGSIPIVTTASGAVNVQAGGSLATSGTVTVTTATTGGVGQRHAATATVSVVTASSGTAGSRQIVTGSVAVVSAVSGAAGQQQAVTALVAIVSATSGTAGRTIPLAGVVVVVSAAIGSPVEGGWVGPIIPRVLVGYLRDDGQYVGRLHDNGRYEARVR